MPQVTLKGNPVHLAGDLPKIGSPAPDFILVGSDLKNNSLADFKGLKKVISVVPSLDTDVCSAMAKRFNEEAKKLAGVAVIVVSADLPFAQKRFCGAANADEITTLSMMRSKEFGKDWGILIKDGPLAGLLARAVFVLDQSNKVLYIQLVPEISQEPDYAKVLQALH